MTTVLLVDDQELVRAGFRIILQSEPGIEVIGEASNGADGVALARSLNPDVICMDVQMPGMDGLEATRMIVADDTVTAGVLMLTTFDRDDYLFEALQAGASGFLLKTASPEHLIDAVQVVARGDALLSPSVTRRSSRRSPRHPRPSCAPARPAAPAAPAAPARAKTKEKPAPSRPKLPPSVRMPQKLLHFPQTARGSPRTASPTASARCSRCWHPGSRTPRSRPVSSWARPP